MTIKKVISIQNVGRFLNCKQKGPELNRYSLVFAENGRGKTTLCAVFRSLQSSVPEHITERISLPPSGNLQTVELRLVSGTARFAGNIWTIAEPNIAIFDATFIAQNVHAGEFISRDHRTNLLQVIIGQKGVRLAKKVEDLDGTIRTKNSEIQAAKRDLEAKLYLGIDADKFVAVVEDPDVATKIVTVTASLSAAKSASDIKKRAALTAIVAPQLPNNFMNILSTTIADVSADAEEKVQTHIADHGMGNDGMKWISDGLEYTPDDKCPFCDRDGISALPLVAAFKQLFSETYAVLRESVNMLETDLEQKLGPTTWAEIERDVETNAAGIEFWSQFMDINLTKLDLPAIAKARKYLHETALALIQQKKANPLEDVNISVDFQDAYKYFTEVCSNFSAYEKAVIDGNALIKAKKDETAAADEAVLQKKLQELKLIELRSDATVKALCKRYKDLKGEKAKLDEEKAAAKTALDVHSDSMIKNYQTAINSLLDGFGAGFTITGSKKSYTGGTPTSSYQITINDHPVDLGDGSTPLGQPCFRTALSAGDKSTLALAFFLAQLDHDPDKAAKILVFDDPFNSQDRSRRERTAELLKKYGSESTQLILLSHDPHFLNLVYKKLPASETHCVQLSRATNNTSTIEEWDIKKETQADYFKDHTVLSSYTVNGGTDRKAIIVRIRPVMEGYLRHRFPGHFQDNHWLGDMINVIRNAGDTHPMFNAVPELTAINDYSKKYHHDTNPGKADTETLDDGELKTFVKRTLAVTGGY